MRGEELLKDGWTSAIYGLKHQKESFEDHPFGLLEASRRSEGLGSCAMIYLCFGENPGGTVLDIL